MCIRDSLSYGDGYSDVLTINELTATKLVLAFEDWDNLDDGSLELDDITTTTYIPHRPLLPVPAWRWRP